MLNVITDAETFTYMKTRAQAYAEDGYPECDPKMIPLLQKLNQHAGIASVWCCTGHPNVDNDTEFYLVLVVDTSGVIVLGNIYEHLCRSLETPIGADGIDISVNRQFGIKLETGILVHPEKDQETYRMWSSEWMLPTRSKLTRSSIP